MTNWLRLMLQETIFCTLCLMNREREGGGGGRRETETELERQKEGDVDLECGREGGGAPLLL